MGNSFGKIFQVMTFGESHGKGLGVVIDGCPAGHPFPYETIRTQLSRRRPGQSKLTSTRQESDQFEVLSGVEAQSQQTLGTPIALLFRNEDARGRDYQTLANVYRPSHADYTYDARFGLRAVEGGGRASARETIGRVAAGALAEDILAAKHGIEIVAWVDEIDGILAKVDEGKLTRENVDATVVRCPDLNTAQTMESAIAGARKQGDTLGGMIGCIVRGVPPGWGAPVFDKLTADLAKALMSLPASRGFTIGEGYKACQMKGSEHNDPFYFDANTRRVRTTTNHSGGIQGGISNGENIRISVAFKPVATIFKPQQTVTREGQSITYQAQGRHDPCVLPRAVPMVEAMVALVLVDHMLRTQIARIDTL